MKLTQILILLGIISYVCGAALATCVAAANTCEANECCDTTTLKCKATKGATAYEFTKKTTSDHDCVALDAAKCYDTAQYIAATPAAALCKDATTKECRAVASNYAYGVKAVDNFECVAVVAGTNCVDDTTKVIRALAGQTLTTVTAAYCQLATSNKCQTLGTAAGTYTHGFTSATSFTCVPIVATITGPTGVEVLTGIARVITATSDFCYLTTTAQYKKYLNGLERYTVLSTDFTCVATTAAAGKCGGGVCAINECCDTTCKTDATKCLTAATTINCAAKTDTLFYPRTNDATCLAVASFPKNFCQDATTKASSELTSASTSCSLSGVCTLLKDGTTVKYTFTDSATLDFTCKAAAADTTTTTTTTTTNAQIQYLVGLLLLISYILI